MKKVFSILIIFCLVTFFYSLLVSNVYSQVFCLGGKACHYQCVDCPFGVGEKTCGACQVVHCWCEFSLWPKCECKDQCSPFSCDINVPGYCTNICESDCGASPECDGRQSNSDITKSCRDFDNIPYTGGTCNQAGKTYFQDKCDSYCRTVDKNNICRSPGSLCDFKGNPTDGCTADPECNGVLAGTGNCDAYCNYVTPTTTTPPPPTCVDICSGYEHSACTPNGCDNLSDGPGLGYCVPVLGFCLYDCYDTSLQGGCDSGETCVCYNAEECDCPTNETCTKIGCIPSVCNINEDCCAGLSDIWLVCKQNTCERCIPSPPSLTTTGNMKGIVDITGSLVVDGFKSYTIEYRDVTDQNWVQIMNLDVLPVSDLLFENWDTSLLSDGTYFLRLTETFNNEQKSYDQSLIWVDNIYISSPKSEEVVTRSVEVKGTATGANFQSYDLKYAIEDDPDVWISDRMTLVGGEVIDGTLGTWDVSSLISGSYLLKLTVYNTDGHISEDIVIVRVDNELHDGWPVSTGEAWGAFTPTIADLDGDGYLEIIIRGNHSVFAYHHDGTPVAGWPRAMVGYADSIGPLPGVSVGDIDDDGEPEVVTGWVEYSSASGYCAYAWEADGTPVAGWPVTCSGTDEWGTYFSSAVLEDLDGNGDLEIISAAFYLGKVFVWNHDGSDYTGWPQGISQPSSNNIVMYSPAVGDIDNDGDIEVVVHYINEPYSGNSMGYLYAWKSNGDTEDGFPIQIGEEAYGTSPVLVDLDNDGDLEIGLTYNYHLIGKSKFIHHNGTPFDGWPLTGEIHQFYSSIALGNVDLKDGTEVIFGKYDGYYVESDVYVMYKNGTIKTGWPQKAKGSVWAQPVIGDIDGDRKLDVITTTYDKRVYAWSSEGVLLNGFPKHLSYESQSGAAIGDIDKNGKVELIAAGEDGKIFVWDLEGAYRQSRMECPMFRNNETHTGLFVPICEGDIDKNGIVNILDILIVAVAFGSQPGDDNWNPIADVYENGYVNILDILIIAIHFGEAC